MEAWTQRTKSQSYFSPLIVTSMKFVVIECLLLLCKSKSVNSFLTQYILCLIPVCDMITGLDIDTEFYISPNIGFHRASATGLACRQGTLTPPDTWSRPILDLHMSTCRDQSFSRTCHYFSGLCYSNIRRSLDFALIQRVTVSSK